MDHSSHSIHNMNKPSTKFSKENKSEFLRGLTSSFPIIIGYFPIAISFGVITLQSGYSLSFAFLMSLFVYAGASQFMAINMLLMQALGIEIIIATFVLNFRHFIMSMSLMNKLKSFPTIKKIPLSFMITDETFAFLSLAKEQDEKNYNLYYIGGLLIGAYSAWVSGTLAGGLLAMVIPPSIGNSMSMGLYAMFIALLIPAIRDQWRMGIVAGLSALLCILITNYINPGWAIVISTLIASFFGSYLIKGE
ncbi:AzlC family ABC transporter permease [Serpentinicella sp. ANB-PHB4]|uniref:AzlC family ABC transporter permease n=1 Tax=Serpentinicella sp. ANB-PHB4 TaxID=3074076 RepID=UPI00285AD7F8|nr:AzlC family ABC transporter permease [Serpentinicella sp. ANB-PHB4]MDR5659434.1 AzlC family ABC transporter permease [Serpentinicella sp. ANB-PHB4]